MCGDIAREVARVPRRLWIILPLLLVLEESSFIAERCRLGCILIDRWMSWYDLVLVGIWSFVRLISRCQSAIGRLSSQSVLNPSTLIPTQKSSIGAIPIGWAMYGQRILLSHVRHRMLCRRISRRRWLTPCHVRAHACGLDGDREIAKLVVVAEYKSRLTSQYVYLCPGESVLH